MKKYEVREYTIVFLSPSDDIGTYTTIATSESSARSAFRSECIPFLSIVAVISKPWIQQ